MLICQNKRRKEPSFIVPFIFELLEMIMIWIVFGVIEGTLDIMQWSLNSYILSSLWSLYTLYKLKKILRRQAFYLR